MKKWMNSIRIKVVLGYVIIVVSLFIVFMVVNIQLQNLQAEKESAVTKILEVQKMTDEVETNLFYMEGNQRGYIVTGSATYEETYNDAYYRWNNNVEKLKALLKNYPEQLSPFINIEKDVKEWVTLTAVPTIEMRKKNELENIRRFFKEDVGRRDINNIYSQFTELKKMEADKVMVEMQDIHNRIEHISWLLFFSLLAVAIIAIIIGRTSSRKLTNKLKYVTNTIAKISRSQNNLEERIEVEENDEVRDLAVATNRLLDQIEDRTWLSKQRHLIVSSYQGVSTLPELAEIFLSTLSKSIHATQALFFVKEEEIFRRYASFSLSSVLIANESFQEGEGLIGQVAKEKTNYIAQDISIEFPDISSGILDVPPKTLFIVPILHMDSTIAVVEFTSVRNFTEIEQDLVESVTTTFGLTIDSVLRRKDIVQLLSKSQWLTDELLAQSKELHLQSDELQVQSEALQLQKQQLIEANEQLEKRTNEAETRSEDLKIAKERIEEKTREIIENSRYKSEFFANVSHELRTPLNSILLLSEMMRENGMLDEEGIEFATIIHSSGQDLLALINDILELSKVGAGKMNRDISGMSLTELVERLQSTFQLHAIKQSIKFIVQIGHNVRDSIYTDELKLQQILKNLLANAFKFTHEGRIQMRVENVTNLTESMVNVSDQWIQIVVSDTGIGVEKDKQQQIFESFQQANGTIEREYGGTGLGLAICNEYAKLIGGTIHIESELGEGSTFTVMFPNLYKEVEQSSIK